MAETLGVMLISRINKTLKGGNHREDIDEDQIIYKDQLINKHYWREQLSKTITTLFDKAVFSRQNRIARENMTGQPSRNRG